MIGYNKRLQLHKQAKINKKGFKIMDTTVRARVDSDLKQEAEAIFKKLGLNTSQAIVMFFALQCDIGVIIKNKQTLILLTTTIKSNLI